uniref:Uncharacterized protein n=1 Tax=Anguilla anguilla TaxID=7936 RepID=A0A0E9URF7_ANGAN
MHMRNLEYTILVTGTHKLQNFKCIHFVSSVANA